MGSVYDVFNLGNGYENIYTATPGADGTVRSIDNRKIARLAKLAGAPEAKAAGLELYVQLHQRVSAGEPVCSVHAETPGELRYALDYASANPGIIEVAQQ